MSLDQEIFNCLRINPMAQLMARNAIWPRSVSMEGMVVAFVAFAVSCVLGRMISLEMIFS